MSIRDEMIQELQNKVRRSKNNLLERQNEKKGAESAIEVLIPRIADIKQELERLLNDG